MKIPSAALSCILLPCLLAAQTNPKDSLLALFPRLTTDSARAQVLMDIGKLYANLSPDSALFYYGLATPYAQRSNFVRGLAKLKINAANAHLDQGDTDQALALLDEAVALCQKLGMGKSSGRPTIPWRTCGITRATI